MSVSLCVVTGDGEHNLRRCLESAAGFVDEMVVVDTGSSDRTPGVAKEFGARVFAFPWSKNSGRLWNYLLDRAQEEWILLLNADEELGEGSGGVLAGLTEAEGVEGYFIKIVNLVGNGRWVESYPDLAFRLFKNRSAYRFRGPIGEQIADVVGEKTDPASCRIAEEFMVISYHSAEEEIEKRAKKDAHAAIVRELERDPGNRFLRYQHGVELFHAEKFAEAASEFHRAAAGIDSKAVYLPKLIRHLVISQQSARQYEQALETISSGLQLFPDYADLYYYGGLVSLDLGRHSLARQYFLKAVSMPEQPARYASFAGVRGFRSFYQLGQIAEMFLDVEEALKCYLISLRDNSSFVPSLEGTIGILRPRQDPDNARAAADRIFHLGTPAAHRILGEVFFHHRAYSLALEYLEKGLEDGPNPNRIHLMKAICLIQVERHFEALKILEDFPPQNSLFAVAEVNRLFCFWVQGRTRKVRAILTKLGGLDLAQDLQSLLLLLAEVSERKERRTKVFLGPDGADVLLDIVGRMLYLGKAETALRFLQQIEPESLRPYLTTILGLLHEFGCGEAVLTVMEDFPETDWDAEIDYIAAEIFRELDDDANAERHYRRALEKDPNPPKYRLRLVGLRDAGAADSNHIPTSSSPGSNPENRE